MILYKKLLHRVNFEDVSIETTLKKQHYLVGEQVSGLVEVTGGKQDADLGYLYLYLKSEYAKDSAQPLMRTEVKLDKFIIGHPFRIKARQVEKSLFLFLFPFIHPLLIKV